MKKILFIFLLFFALLPSGVSADDNISKIFKLEAYDYQELTNSFYMQQYGSAVYFGDNLIYTNAHVVLDENNEPLGNYRVCKTIDFKKKPECFSVGKLLYYDESSDLAVLQILNPGVKKIVESDKTLEIGNMVKVYGYPSNGGNTITYTEGKISGYENGLYKIDANIDAGNSGGGVFDSDGNFIGMAVSVRVGYTTMGYIIPVGKINDFISKKNSYNIKNYDKTIDSKFLPYSLTLEKTIGASNFSNSQIDLSGFTKYGFNISYYHIDNDNKYYVLGLTDKDEEVILAINNMNFAGNSDLNMDDYYQLTKKEFEKINEDGDYSIVKIKKVKLINRETILIFTQDKDGGVFLSLMIENGKNNFQVLSINGDNIKNKTFLNGLRIMLSKIKIKDYSQSNNNSGNMKMDNLSIGKKDGFYILKNFSGDNLQYVGGDIEVTSSYTSEQEKKYYKDYTLSSIIKENFNYYKDYVYYNYVGIKQTKSGDYYAYNFYLNNQEKGGEIEKLEKKYAITVKFYDNIDDTKFYVNTLSFKFDDKNSKQIIDDLIDSISTNSGELGIELGILKNGENLIESNEFDF